jgi:hypothetical protein
MPSATDNFEGHRYIRTITGRKFHLFGDDPEEIDLQDICVALSHMARFTGHTNRLYSVAEHSLLVHDILWTMFKVRDPVVLLSGLLHDSTEAYLADISAPFKGALGNYRELEDRVWGRIASKWGLPHEMDPRIKEADWIALFAEAIELQDPERSEIHTWKFYDQWGSKAEQWLDWVGIPDMSDTEAAGLLKEAVNKYIDQLVAESYAASAIE